MERELIVNSTPSDVEIALMENRRLVEMHHQKPDNNFAVGDIFLGEIKKIMPGLNAAFLDIGHRKDAFLHYTDLGPQIKSLIKFTEGGIKGNVQSHSLETFELEPDNKKNGKMDHVFNRGSKVLVQVLKEPISTKGPRMSCEITIPGRFVVLTPFNDVIAVSKKIQSDDERSRLKLLGESIKPKKFGLIIRTAAQGKRVADLHEELRHLEDKWKSLFSQLKKSSGPDKLLSEVDKTTSFLRDVVNDSYNKIVINDKAIYNNIKSFMTNVAPQEAKKVSLYKGKRPIFEAFGVNKQVKSAFGKTSTMPSGAYLIIEHTEAMHVVDVNSGPKMKKMSQEDAAIAVNIEAAQEIARQLRLRDLGGIILVDFIDMKSSENRKKLFHSMRNYMQNDRAQHTILPLSKFGLMQITRQRTRPELVINTTEQCPSCSGTGKVDATIVLEDEIQRDLANILESMPNSKISLKVHPIIYSHLKYGWMSIQMQWLKKYMKWIRIERTEDYEFNEYKFFAANGDQIRLN